MLKIMQTIPDLSPTGLIFVTMETAQKSLAEKNIDYKICHGLDCNSFHILKQVLLHIHVFPEIPNVFRL